MDRIFQVNASLINALALVILSSRLLSSPLKAFPGPLLAQTTNAYASWYTIKSDLHLVTYMDHLKHGLISSFSTGSVARSAPNRLVFNTLSATQDIYLNARLTEARIYVNARFRIAPSVSTALDRVDHRRRRIVVGRAMSERSVREFEPTMVSQFDISLSQLLDCSQQDEVAEMTSRCKYLIMDVIGLLAFGCSWKTQTEETLGSSGDGIERFRKLRAGMTSDRMALPRDAKHDLFSVVVSDDRIDEAEQEGIRKSEIWGEAAIFVNAGDTTTATAMCTALYCLSRNPSIYTRLASEVRRASPLAVKFATDHNWWAASIFGQSSTRRCVFSPQLLGRLEQDPLSTEPPIVDGHVIPRGPFVGVGAHSLMNYPEYFPELSAFRFRRWMEEDDGIYEDKEARATMRRASIPFILGDCACAGEALAYLEMSWTIDKMIWGFDFEKGPEDVGELGSGRKGATRVRDRPDEYQLYDRFIAEHEGPNLIFRPPEQHWRDLI